MHLDLSSQHLDTEPHLYACVRIAKKLIKSVQVVVEIGANDCVETIAFAKEYPNARIIAFECNPDTLPLCRERVAPYKNIDLVETAIGTEEGQVSFFKAKKSGGDWNTGASSLYQANTEYTSLDQEEITVPISTLETQLERLAVSSIDILWMDIQGGELSALMGMNQELLENTKLIHTEVEHYTLYKKQPLFQDIRAFLRQRGFRLYTYTTVGRNFSDVVFVNTRIHTPIIPEWMIIFGFTAKERLTGKLRGLRSKLLSK